MTNAKPRLLDLFCGAGGAGMGYYRAGFEVVGVDIAKQPRYPFEFIQADALEYVQKHGREFDAIHASPPCQAHTPLRKMWNSRPHEDLIPQTRELLHRSDMLFVMENVPGAPLEDLPMFGAHRLMLCGTMFELRTRCGAELQRHRLFEMNWRPMIAPPCRHGWAGVIGVYGGHTRDRRRTITVTGATPQQNVVRNTIRKTFSVKDAQVAMGIDWMTMENLSQAIPPAYTELIGKQLIEAIR